MSNEDPDLQGEKSREHEAAAAGIVAREAPQEFDAEELVDGEPGHVDDDDELDDGPDAPDVPDDV